MLVTIFWIVALLVWSAVSPWYNLVLAKAATFVFHKVPFFDCQVTYHSERNSIKAHTFFSVRKAPDGAKEYYEGDPSWDGRRFHFSFTVWTALLLATPFGGNWRRKSLWFIVGWVAVFLTQLLGLYLQTIHHNMLFFKTLLSTGRYMQPSGFEIALAFAGRYFLLIGNILFPLLIWLPIGTESLRVPTDFAMVSEKTLHTGRSVS